MLTLRLFIRHTLVACLLMFAIVLATPASAPAKDYMVNGQDGAEGDPTDGNDFIGGGSSDVLEPDTNSIRPVDTQPIVFSGMIFFLFDSAPDYLYFVTPIVTGPHQILPINKYVVSGGNQ